MKGWSFTRSVLGVVHRKGVYHRLDKIKTSTLIVVGDEDVATVPEKSHRMHQAIAGSQMLVIEKAGHTSSIEQPEAITRVISEFINSVS